MINSLKKVILMGKNSKIIINTVLNSILLKERKHKNSTVVVNNIELTIRISDWFILGSKIVSKCNSSKLIIKMRIPITNLTIFKL